MSGNPLHSFGASDSGILDGFRGLLPKSSRIDAPPNDPSKDDPSQADSSPSLNQLPDGDRDLPSAMPRSIGDDLEGELRDVSLPEGFLRRMRDAFDGFSC
ncbi:MAG: hypothetical protein AAF589_05175 [Planctomycetota bacterium]